MDLPYLTSDLPGIGGALRTTDDDFFVDEEPAYLPTGTGDHVFVKIEKRGLTTPFAVDRIAKALAVNPRDIGVAGMKDRHAVTRQWLSLPPPVTPEAARALVLEDIAIVEVARHPHKLRTGHVRANRFVLVVRGVHEDALPRAQAILARLVAPPGAPNWYGEQRFGRDGDNAERGLAIVRGGKPPRDRKLARLLVSSLQSQLFNDWLVARMADGLYASVLAGDILKKTSGGQFVCDDPPTDQARLAAGEISITGPMFGDSMRAPPDATAAAEREDAILRARGLERGAFASVRQIAEGTRRDAAISIGDATARLIEPAAPEMEPGRPPRTGAPEMEPGRPARTGAIEIAFSLPGGAYATAVMREIMKSG